MNNLVIGRVWACVCARNTWAMSTERHCAAVVYIHPKKFLKNAAIVHKNLGNSGTITNSDATTGTRCLKKCHSAVIVKVQISHSFSARENTPIQNGCSYRAGLNEYIMPACGSCADICYCSAVIDARRTYERERVITQDNRVCCNAVTCEDTCIGIRENRPVRHNVAVIYRKFVYFNAWKWPAGVSNRRDGRSVTNVSTGAASIKARNECHRAVVIYHWPPWETIELPASVCDGNWRGCTITYENADLPV